MNKYKYYIIITAALFVIALFLYFRDKPGTLKADRKSFAIADTAAVTSIRIDDGTHKLVLKRLGNNWQVNQNFIANARAVKGTLLMLMNLEITSPLPKSMKSEILKNANSKIMHVSVELYDNEVKTYKIIENDSLKEGSVMQMEHDDELYVVGIPGFHGRISLLFSTNASMWRDKTIFKYRPDDILSIEVEYKSNPKASFQYQFLGPDNLIIKSKVLNQSVSIDKEIAKKYLMNFTSVSYVHQALNRSKIVFDSLSIQQPFCVIRVNDVANQINTVKTYQIPMPGKSKEYNPDLMYAVIQNDTVPVYIKYLDFDPIMKEYNDFVSR
jgi:hypothetical protein